MNLTGAGVTQGILVVTDTYGVSPIGVLPR
jgi:hypothetical protein